MQVDFGTARQQQSLIARVAGADELGEAPQSDLGPAILCDSRLDGGSYAEKMRRCGLGT